MVDRGPGVIETARSGRSSCRRCGTIIDAGTLRFGAVDPRRSQPGKPSYRWYHLVCATKAMPVSFAATLEAHEGDVPQREALMAEMRQAAPDIPVGTEAYNEAGEAGEVIWFGKSRYDESMRVGLKLVTGEVLWLPASEVTVLRASG